jgi:AhpD family alkylhydroperoxidase
VQQLAGELPDAIGELLDAPPPPREESIIMAAPKESLQRLRSYRSHRERMNARILETATLETKRYFALDAAVYRSGALPVRTKELLGLVASLVLRCDDCVTYHLVRCREEGLSREEMVECMDVGLVVGGSIVIPHLRRAADMLDALETEAGNGSSPAPVTPRAAGGSSPAAPRTTRGSRPGVRRQRDAAAPHRGAQQLPAGAGTSRRRTS